MAGRTAGRRCGLAAPAVRPLKQDVVGDIGKVLWIVMATVGIVNVIAWASVANLVLVPAATRAYEEQFPNDAAGPCAERRPTSTADREAAAARQHRGGEEDTEQGDGRR